MPMIRTRREFVRDLGVSAAAVPFVLNLPSLGFANQGKRKQRLVVIFSPNGIVPPAFWPDEEGELTSLQGKPHAARAVPQADAHPARRLRQDPRRRRRPHARHRLPAHRHRALPRQHPGRLRHAGRLGQGHLDRPGDQELPPEGRRRPRTRFGSLEFGVMVPDRADTWTRMELRRREQADRADRRPVPDVRQALRPGARTAKRSAASSTTCKDDLKKVGGAVGAADKKLLDEHATFVREMEQELKEAEGRGARPRGARARAGRQARQRQHPARSARCRST